MSTGRLEYGFQLIVGDGDVQTICGDNGSYNQNGGFSLSQKKMEIMVDNGVQSIKNPC